MGRGAWWAAVHGVAKSQTRLSDFTFTFHFHALEKEMATHSSILAWRIPGMRGAWWAAAYGVAQSQTRLKRLSSSSSSSPSLSSKAGVYGAVHPGHPEKAWGSQHTPPLSSLPESCVWVTTPSTDSTYLSISRAQNICCTDARVSSCRCVVLRGLEDAL